MVYTKILGTGSYLPEKVLTNYDLEKMVETTHEWIFERTGIASRHIAASHETTSSMSLIASQRALEAAGSTPSEIDMIIVATTTPDQILPSSACKLQEMLGIKHYCPAFDITAACAGFSYILSIADKFIRSGDAKKVLVVGAEIMSRITNWNDRSTCILFGDGAGATILGASDEPGIESTALHAGGCHQDLITISSGLCGQRKPDEEPFVIMKGNEVFKLAVTHLGEVVDEVLAKANLSKQDVDWLIPHQANMRIISAMAKKLSLPMEKVIMTIEHQGNTSSASIPLALDWAIRQNIIKRGERLLLESFGAGITWGATLLRY